MGLLESLQDDPEKLAALRQGLLSAGAAMLAGGRQDFGTSLGQGLGAGVKTYADKFEESRKKALAMAPYKAAMTPARPAVPAAYKTGGASYPDRGQAELASQNGYMLTQAANPYGNGIPQDDGLSIPGMPASLQPQPMGIEDMGGMGAPYQPGQVAPIEEQAAQPAQAAGFNQAAFEDAILQDPSNPAYQKLVESRFAGKENKPQLVTVYGEDGRPMQKWVRPGESSGVDVGAGKPDSSASSGLGKLIAERDALPQGHPARAMYDQAIEKTATHAPSAQMNNYGSPVAGVGPDGKPVFFQPSKGGGTPSIVPGIRPEPKDKAQNITEGERKSATLLRRLDFSEKQLQAALAENSKAEKPGLIQNGLRSIGADAAANVLTGSERQRVESAQLDILDAALTLGTGAAYTKEQLMSYRQSYFPQLGDGPGQIKDKEARLKNIVEAAKIAAGRAAPTESPKLPASPKDLPKKPVTNPKYPGFSIVK